MSSTRRRSRIRLLAAAMVVASVPVVAAPAQADHTPDPSTVTIAGSLQDELGCTGDWQPECLTTGLDGTNPDGVWRSTFSLPAGNWEYKAALNGSWDENYGAGGVQNGANIPLSLTGDTDVRFYYDHETHWITDAVNSRIVTAAGSFQDELGCPGEWQPWCLRSWLQDPDGDDVYTFTTTDLPSGSYEWKAAIDEDWAESYGVGGGADNVPFTVPADNDPVTFSFDSGTNVPTVSVTTGGGLEPGDEDLVTDPVTGPGEDEIIYFVMPDRFANGDTSNDHGGVDPAAGPLEHGFLPTDKGFHHGGDLVGLRSKLDYLQGLGVTAIWMTPAFTNNWVQGDGTVDGSSSSYHGYWQTDFTQIDPHLGTNAEMLALIDDAHARGMKVYFDIVANHTGDVINYEGFGPGGAPYVSKDDAPYTDSSGVVFDDRDFAGGTTFPELDPATSFPYVPTFPDPDGATAKAPAFLNDVTNYHNRGNSTFTGENSLYGDFVGLDDLFTEKPEVVQGMIDVHTAMIDTFGIDGFRVDTVKHVNDEFWEAFVPAIRAHAAAAGIDDFSVFGEVFDGNPAFLSRFSTELPFPATLDFRFNGTIGDIAASSTGTDRLSGLFADDDWFTDTDSDADELRKFAGNHDEGRIGHRIKLANPGADDAELVARAELTQFVNMTTRGVPIVYYGDEQGFTGDGGDQDARQDMFPSLVPSYIDDDLIGTNATTADDNFDPTHPLYQTIGELTQLRTAHQALRSGAQIERYAQSTAGIYAFSRIDRVEQVEYVVAINNSEADASATFTTATPNATFSEVWPGTGSVATDASGAMSIVLPPLSGIVLRADTIVPTDDVAPTVIMSAPSSGAAVLDRARVGADVDDPAAEVTFAVSIDGGAFEVLGVDTNAPHAVYHDVSALAPGTALRYKAIARDAGGNLGAASVEALVGEPPPPPSGDAKYAIIHYLRDDGDYGDPTSSDFNDFWGVHTWEGAAEPTQWQDPVRFWGEDDYGRFAWFELVPGATNTAFIVHRGDVKDGTDADRFFDVSISPEIWLRQDDANVYYSRAEAQGFATIHYRRSDGDYGDPTSSDYNDFWGVHLWGDAIDPADATEWTSPRRPDGVDDFGAYWNVPLVDATQPLNYIIHRGDEKDPGPDQSFVPVEQSDAYVVSGDETIYPTEAAALNVARLHYRRDAGDYGDPTSPDFNDFWGMHVWTGAASPNPSWQEPVRPAGQDDFGLVFEVPLTDGASELAYIFHRGDEKDPGPDQFLQLDEDGYEVWQLQDADPDDPYLLPVAPSGPISSGNLDEQRAYWVTGDTILWPAATVPSATYTLHGASGGGLALADDGVSGADTEVALALDTSPDPAIFERFPHLSGLPALSLGGADAATVDALLRGQLAISAAGSDGVRIDATGLQIPGVLDDVYASDADLGVTWNGGVPTISVWAPTAKAVSLLRYADSDPATTADVVAMSRDDDGVWSVTGAADWRGSYYVYDVEVYVHAEGAVVHNLVTDPYSVSLSTNSARTQIVDLADPATAPKGWASLDKPELGAPEEISVYELHVRDFSAGDVRVPKWMRGTYAAFTKSKTYGMRHLAALADAGLTHVHLLPVFDIATVDEDRANWQSPDPRELARYAPDSDQQQAAVSETRDLDGFNWGYDPWHYTTPEGSYAADPDGLARIMEFRRMIEALNETGLRVVMDVVYNHTHASGQDDRSVLDRIVPGYYHRLDDTGVVETSTCCANTASEHLMMERLMVDSVVTWARDHKVDGFRFDLMGHHSKSTMLKIRAALDALTIADDGVDGSQIYLYGEGWNFGEVADNARFEQATQLNMAGTGIGTFSDRLRDAVRGGGPFDGGSSLVQNQGFINGLYYDPNEYVQANGPSEADQLDRLLLSADQIRVGLAGNLAGYQLIDRTGTLVTGSQIDYNGSPAGYTADPQENIVYVSAHDNQTLFDIGQYHHPLSTSADDRAKAQMVGIDLTVYAQGVAFLHAGVDTLRSKSMDRDSFNSGDWFNTLDLSYRSNNWAVGLPVAEKNQDNWDIIGPRLADPALAVGRDQIVATAGHARDALAVRASTPLFSLATAADVSDRVRFHNTGPSQLPGLVVMTIDDDPATGLDDLDPGRHGVTVLFNATDEPIEFTLAEAVGTTQRLHPVLAASTIADVAASTFDPTTGTYVVPPRTTAVFDRVAADVTPPVVEASLDPIRVTHRSGRFTVAVSCVDDGPGPLSLEADINGVEVVDGQRVKLRLSNRSSWTYRPKRDLLVIRGPEFTLTATCTDAAGNTSTATYQPTFPPRRPAGVR